MEEGKPTGITREDVERLEKVQFEGQQAQIFDAHRLIRGGVESMELGLDAGGARLALYGHFRGGEFMEVGRRRLD